MEPEQPAPIKPRIVNIKLLGPIGAGKKSLVFRFSQNAFKREGVPTFQIDFMFKMINKDGKKYNLKFFRPKDNNYLTPTKYNHELNELNIDNDYYFNECFTNKKNLFQSVNISRPKLNYENKLNKNLHLTLGSGINRYNYNNYYSENDYGTNKQLIINRTFKLNKNKNKLVLFRKIFVMNNNSKNNKDIKDLSSKSFENNNIHKKLYSTIGNIKGDNKNNNNNNKKEQKKNKIVNYRLINSKELIFTDEIEISDDYVDNNDNEDITNINYQNKRILYKNPEQQSNLDYLINHNIEIIFNNCLDLILCQQQKIDTLLKSIKDLTNPSLKKNPKLKKKMIDSFSSSVMSTFMQTKEGGMNVEDNVKKIFDREKDKYKYRICFLRSFVTRYIIIIDQTSKKIFRNIDDWIISSVALQSEARSLVIQKLKNILKEKRLINEEKDINNIELDAFEESEKEFHFKKIQR